MKRMISALLCLALLLSLFPAWGITETSAASAPWDGQTREDFAGGSGTAEDPYQISNGAQLYQLAQFASKYDKKDDYYIATKGLHYILTADIDMGNKIFSGIPYFSGSLDGAGYRIYNLYISNPETSYMGLIHHGGKCVLRNLTVEGTVSGKSYTGGIVGDLSSGSTLENCVNLCNISGSKCIGGICGFSSADITFCRNMGSLNGETYIGGIVGITYALVNSCENTGAVTGTSKCIGGVAGATAAPVTACINSGTVTGESTTVGGIVGSLTSGSSLESCTNFGAVSGLEYTGGVCGIGSENITKCRNSGSVNGTTMVGGITGFTTGSVISCANTGVVTGSSYDVGGICGSCTGIVTSCWNSGSVNGTDQVGGITGRNNALVHSCANTGAVTGSSDCIGGISGDATANIVSCWNSGSISGTETIGGIVGTTNALLTSCVNTGTVTGSSYYVGGIAGYYYYSGSTHSTLCVNAGTVTGTNSVAGICGLLGGGYFENCYNMGEVIATGKYDSAYGIAYSSKGTISHCYNAGALSGYYRYGVSNYKGSYCYYLANTGANQSINVSLTAEEMTSTDAFIGFDFANTWTWDNSGAYSYPILSDIDLILTPCSADNHRWNEGTEISAAGCTTTGTLQFTCVKCKEFSLQLLPVSGHAMAEIPATPATCTKSGLTAGRRCTRCNYKVTGTVVPSMGHSYSSVYTPPTCTEAGYTTYTCTTCGHSYTGNIENATEHDWNAGVVEVVPGCDNSGKELYTCRKCGDTKEETLPATGHSYSDKVTKPTCTEAGYTVHTCTACGNSYKDSFVDATDHRWDQGVELIEATCTTGGQKVYTCTSCRDTKTEAISAKGHSYTSKLTAPTCTVAGYTTYTCTSCGNSYKDSFVGATNHAWSQGVETSKATCTTPGAKLYTCTSCGETKTEAIPAKGHSYTPKLAEPTCTDRGYTTYTCSVCGDSYTDSYIDALGHRWNQGTVNRVATCSLAGELLYTCGTCGKTKTEAIPAIGHNYISEVTAPTCTEAGFTTYTCGTCGHSYIGNFVAASTHKFKDGACTVCKAKDPTYLPPNPFTDVKEKDYFYIPVLWAVQNGITNGMTATTFVPDAPCTRGQIVTFLWRAYGCPEPKEKNNPFSDVSPKTYYYTAVLWAVEQGITNGLSATTFGPEESCTRGQVATFLWRALGKPTASNNENPFSDVSPKAYYYDAVLWAVEEGITLGTGHGKFSPDDTCTRGQIVTFLYRALS